MRVGAAALARGDGLRSAVLLGDTRLPGGFALRGAISRAALAWAAGIRGSIGSATAAPSRGTTGALADRATGLAGIAGRARGTGGVLALTGGTIRLGGARRTAGFERGTGTRAAILVAGCFAMRILAAGFCLAGAGRTAMRGAGLAFGAATGATATGAGGLTTLGRASRGAMTRGLTIVGGLMRGGRIDRGRDCARARRLGWRTVLRFVPGGLSIIRPVPDRGGATAAGGATARIDLAGGTTGAGDNMRGTLRAGPSASRTLRSTVTAGRAEDNHLADCASARGPARPDNATTITAPANTSIGTANRIPRLWRSAMAFLLVPPGARRRALSKPRTIP